MNHEEIRGFCKEEAWTPWDASWHSWASPVGLGLGFMFFCLGVGILLTSIGSFILLLYHAG